MVTGWHFPAEQVLPGSQLLRQMPQLAPSVLVSTHAELHV
jgi:hypothetical protein